MQMFFHYKYHYYHTPTDILHKTNRSVCAMQADHHAITAGVEMQSNRLANRMMYMPADTLSRPIHESSYISYDASHTIIGHHRIFIYFVLGISG